MIFAGTICKPLKEPFVLWELPFTDKRSRQGKFFVLGLEDLVWAELKKDPSRPRQRFRRTNAARETSTRRHH
jgi:hypothetical protein